MVWFIVSLIFFFGTFKSSIMLSVLLVFVCMGYLLLMIGQFRDQSTHHSLPILIQRLLIYISHLSLCSQGWWSDVLHRCLCRVLHRRRRVTQLSRSVSLLPPSSLTPFSPTFRPSRYACPARPFAYNPPTHADTPSFSRYCFLPVGNLKETSVHALCTRKRQAEAQDQAQAST